MRRLAAQLHLRYSLLVRWMSISLVFAACADPPRVSFVEESRPLGADDYPLILERWTRTGHLYVDLFDTVLFVDATFHAPQFRRAFAARYPEMYGQGRAIADELVSLSNEAEDFHTFFLAAHTNKRRWNDFDSDESIWRMTLRDVSGTREIEPAVIRHRPRDANLARVYPYLSNFRRGYLVRFARAFPDGTPTIGPGVGGFSLRFASSLGVLELVWTLVDEELPLDNP